MFNSYHIETVLVLTTSCSLSLEEQMTHMLRKNYSLHKTCMKYLESDVIFCEGCIPSRQIVSSLV